MYFGTRKYRFELCRKAEVNGKTEYHGRNCVLLVNIAGQKDPRSEMIMDLGDLDQKVNEILDDYDHTTIDYSFEVLLQTIYRRIRKEFYDFVTWITLQENENTLYRYREYSSGAEIMDVTRTYVFHAGHRTHNPALSDVENYEIYGKCNTLHGHEYKLEVTVTGNFNETTGTMIDHNYMNRKVHGVIGKYKNNVLNDVLEDIPHVPSYNATTENFIRALWLELEPALCGENYALYKLKLHETDRNFFEYYG